ncbi:hypothetical protein OS145_07621 [Idiomarina baltica OS145]|uniref:Uncharacterized protein n=1 Tax=Idiomarina baltica OS145 TaxID=314276 RepID=A0ABM9WN24_9GAMM|nr:hypothetical protein OS145_07621 [Idiomarina baltica OS145]
MGYESLLIWVAVMPVVMLGVHLLITFVQSKKKGTD